MYLGKALFRDRPLSSFLSQREGSLGGAVEQHMNRNPGLSDEEIVTYVAEQMKVTPLQIDFANFTKDVQEAKVRVEDYRRDTLIDGVRASRSYPFTGDTTLFQLMPSTHSSVLPYGVVSGKTVTMGIEGRKDLDMLKRELENLEKTLRSYVDFQRGEIEQFNARLTATVDNLVKQRRKHQAEIAGLRDAL